jgi:hypothetical protein
MGEWRSGCYVAIISSIFQCAIFNRKQEGKIKEIVNNILLGTLKDIILYLQDGKVNKSLIEGPVPVCDQVFEKINTCIGNSISISNDGNLVPFSFHGERISFYQPLQEYLISTLSPFLEMKKDYLAFVEKRIIVTLDEESEMGNLLNDVLMQTTKADFSFLSLG